MKPNRTLSAGGFRPVPEVDSITAYQVPRAITPVDLYLDGNEGCPPTDWKPAEILRDNPDLIQRYPDAASLERKLAEKLNLDPAGVLVTAGADEAIDRVCRTALAPGRTMILPVPAFPMFRHYATLAGGRIVTVAWPDGAYPVEEVIQAVDATTSIIVIVSPNNPTGAVASAADIDRLARGAPQALVLVDLAYGEFADEDLTPAALAHDNCVVLRSFSKAGGMAGLRVGYAVGSPAIVSYLRRAGGPYTVSSLSLALAEQVLARSEDREGYFTAVRRNRDRMARALQKLGARPTASQGNFVFARFPDAEWTRAGLAGLGIAARGYPDDRDLRDFLRITVPHPDHLDRLLAALGTVLAPEAILFDMDGVLADVSGSYRQAIIETAARYGVTVTGETITSAKRAGDANNDWHLTHSLIKEQGGIAAFEDVKRTFEGLYHGDGSRPGLWIQERPLCGEDLLRRLRRKVKLGIVTGRPRRDAQRFLAEHNLAEFFDVVVCLEDAPAKPSPEPVRLARRKLGVTRAWMIGDTPDDMRAARAAGVLPVGIAAPGESAESGTALLRSGAGRILDSLKELTELIP